MSPIHVAVAALIDFETVPGEIPADQVEISNQFLATEGVTFSLSNGNNPFLEARDELDVGNSFINDQRSTADVEVAAYGGALGNFFLRFGTGELFSAPVPELVIDYATPVGATSGQLWDIDGHSSGTEQWEVTARDINDAVIETLVSPLGVVHDSTSLDGKPWVWSFDRTTDDISSVRIRFIGNKNLIGLAFDNFSASTAPIDDVAVTPLPGPASCYAGTSGTDHVIFLKGKTSQADCDAIGGGSPCLARREFPGDGPDGKPVSLLAAIIQRPSVTGAGDIVAFTEFGFNVCQMATNSEDTEGCAGRGLLGVDPHSISISPAGTALALTRLDDTTFRPKNEIYVLDPGTLAVLESYVVTTTDPGGDTLQVETVDFTVDGDYLIFDAFNPATGLWGIYAVSRSTGVTTTVVAPVPGLIIRNPALAQTSDDHMVFDVQNINTATNVVFAANLLTGEFARVATTSILGYPSYTGDDSAIVFNELDTGVVSLSSLDIQPVADDRLEPVGARTRWLNDGGVPEVYRRGTWDGTLLDPSACEGAPDGDGDGVPDNADNCSADFNPDQRDTNGDNFGNICDPDFNGNNVVDPADFSLLKSRFGQPGFPDQDLNGNGVVDPFDFSLLKSKFGQPPGPSGLVP